MQRLPVERVRLLVTDLDNTLFDWFSMWHASFSAMLDQIVVISGLPVDQLEYEIREIHQQRRTSEYSYLTQELPSLQRKHRGQDLGKIYRPAIDAYRTARDATLQLYPHVRDTLHRVRELGVITVAYTESLEFYTSYRIRALGLDELLDFIYSPADHDFPAGIDPKDLRSQPPDNYILKHAVHRNTPAGHLKPQPEVLRTIVDQFAVSERSVAYVGDSLMKDVAMAQEVGVIDVHAAYGVPQESTEYDLLRRVSHWTDEDVRREREIMTQPHVTPSVTLEESFAELLECFVFGM